MYSTISTTNASHLSLCLLKPSGSDVEDAGDAANPEERESKT